jgi:hypothetical protein
MLIALRRLWLFASPIAFFLLVLTIWKGPDFLGWYDQPLFQDRMTCAPAVRGAARAMVELQLVSIVVGVVLGGILAVVTRKKVTASLGPAATPSPAAAPGSPAAVDQKNLPR